MLLFAAGALMVVFHHFLTPWGPWAFSDSADYIEAARNLARGWGLVTRVSGGHLRLLTEHAPGYAVMLSLGFHFTSDWVAIARWEDLIALGVFVLLWGRLFWRILDNPLAGIVAIEVIGITFAFVRAFTSAMSEPWYLVWSTASLVLLERDLRVPRWWQSIAVGAFALLAALTRYAGLYLAVVLLFAYAALGFEPMARRWLRGGGVAFLPVAGVLGWMFYARTAGGGFAGRFAHSALHIFESAAEYAQKFASLLLKGNSSLSVTWLQTALVWTSMLAVASASFYIAWRMRRHPRHQWFAQGVGILTLGAGLYPLAIGAFFALGHPKPTVDLRMFTPAYFAALGAALLWLVFVAKMAAERLGFQDIWVVYALVAIVLAVWAYKTPFYGRIWGEQVHRYGMGYTNREWHFWARSRMYRYLRQQPADLLFITDDWVGLRLWCDHKTAALPRHKPPILPLGKGSTPRDRIFAQGKAILVLPKPAWAGLARLGDPEKVVRALTAGLKPCYQGKWGLVYAAKECK